MAITLADFNKIWASSSPLTPYSFTENNYKQGWNFIGSTPPARQMWDFLQKNNDEKMQYLANNYLPLTGGTMTGDIAFNGSEKWVKKSTFDGALGLAGGTGFGQGGSISLFGKTHGTWGGSFWIVAHDGTNEKRLIGKPDGTLAWGEQNILTASNYNSYALPLAGGTMTGGIKTMAGDCLLRERDNTHLTIGGGSGYNNGASILLAGKEENSSPYQGRFILRAYDGTSSKSLAGQTDGTLTWDGQPIQTSSDKRLKRDFSNVPDDVLEAWGKVNWQQFKYKADVERKGENCRFHTGLVAQDVKEVGEENNVDLLKYGILCHDVREAVEEEKDEDGNIIREASEAVDLWTVRYTEALCMEAAYQRRRADRLEERIAKLEALMRTE